MEFNGPRAQRGSKFFGNEEGVGIFSSEYEDNGRKMISVGLWDRITPVSCRWRQAASADGGRTWEHNWLMDWRRVR